jgi:hypothetical protein
LAARTAADIGGGQGAASRAPQIRRDFPNAAVRITNPEQLADYKAACQGKITWAQYFKKWKGALLPG